MIKLFKVLLYLKYFKRLALNKLLQLLLFAYFSNRLILINQWLIIFNKINQGYF